MSESEEQKQKPSRLGINIRPETGNKVKQLQVELEKKYGIKFSAASVVEYLVNNYIGK